MKNIFKEITAIIDQYKSKPDFLDALFDKNKTDALSGKPIVICCAGDLGIHMILALRKYGINPVLMCDNNPVQIGRKTLGLTVVSFHTAIHKYPDALFIIAVHKYRKEIHEQLIGSGIPPSSIKCADEKSDLIYLYIGTGTQTHISTCEQSCKPLSYIEYLKNKQDRILLAHDILFDEKSRKLLITKLALVASHGQFSLFADYIREFSEPYKDFGLMGYDGTPEDYYYFNNDVFNLNNGEIYIDIGAFDGDTVETFISACAKGKIKYQKIIAFEPDPNCFNKLSTNYTNYDGVELHQLGLWSESTQLRFLSTNTGTYEQGASISSTGDISIDVVSLDDFLQGNQATLVKMDPPGNIIPNVLRGAILTIKNHRPNLAIGAYHGADSIFEIPILLHSICPDYRMAIRQNTCHLSDTDLMATVAR